MGGATFVAASLEGAHAGIIKGQTLTNCLGTATFGVWVSPQFRRMGIGDALVDKIIEWSRSSGFKKISLKVADINAVAILLYERKGFAMTGLVNTLPPPRSHIKEKEMV